MRKIKPVVDRFWASVQKTDDCWMWIGGQRGKGYGFFNVMDARLSAHRFSWELANQAKVPDGMCVCHRCDVRLCVRPDHLFLGTVAENNQDRDRKGRGRDGTVTHCKHGHPFTGDNLRITARGERACRTCIRGWAKDKRVRRNSISPPRRPKLTAEIAQQIRAEYVPVYGRIRALARQYGVQPQSISLILRGRTWAVSR